MLVLSRRAQQQITFPGLGITLSILQVRGRIVKVGIEAPANVKVMRPEAGVSNNQRLRIPDKLQTKAAVSDDEEHRRRNQLNALQLFVDAVQMRLQRNEDVDAKNLMRLLFKSLGEETYEIASPAPFGQGDPNSANRELRVLVVEDSENERGLLTYLLASHGFIVYVARDGTEALDQLRHGCGLPDVVLMDVDMPFGNGIETLQYFRRDVTLSHLQIYAVTGSSRDRNQEPVGRGWDRWFSKPVDVRKLVAAIHEDCGAIARSNLVSHSDTASLEVPS